MEVSSKNIVPVMGNLWMRQVDKKIQLSRLPSQESGSIYGVLSQARPDPRSSEFLNVFIIVAIIIIIMPTPNNVLMHLNDVKKDMYVYTT